LNIETAPKRTNRHVSVSKEKAPDTGMETGEKEKEKIGIPSVIT